VWQDCTTLAVAPNASYRETFKARASLRSNGQETPAAFDHDPRGPRRYVVRRHPALTTRDAVQVSLAIPMYLLYEGGILVARLVTRSYGPAGQASTDER